MFFGIRNLPRWEKRVKLGKSGNDADPYGYRVKRHFHWFYRGFAKTYGGERGIRTLDRAFDPITV
jgi:hypothetical protein